MALVTLLLAFTPEKPDGDIEDKLVLTIPLSASGHVDNASLTAEPSRWGFMREQPDRDPAEGNVEPSSRGWILRWGGEGGRPPLEITGAILRPGEYMTLMAGEQSEAVYRVVSVEPDQSARKDPAPAS